MNCSDSRKLKLVLMVVVSFVLFGLFSTSSAADNPIVGKWGYVDIEHHNDGTWVRTLGTTVFNANGTGTNIFNYNWGGGLGSQTSNFTYTVNKNFDRSWNFEMTSDGTTDSYRFVLSDDGKMVIFDGTGDPGKQMMFIAIRMDTEKTYTNADLNFDAFGIGYDYDLSKSLWPGYYTTWSAIKHFDGNGNCPFDVTFNSDGIVQTFLNLPDSYTLNADGSGVMMNGRLTGYLGKDERLAIFSYPGVATDWSIALGMRRGDKIYSTADLAGTWALVSFGDEDVGERFDVKFGVMNCSKDGNCLISLKTQEDGYVTYESTNPIGNVSPDGSLSDAPSYATAIGNNGDTIISNGSFTQNEAVDREIMIWVRCSECFNLSKQLIPMISLNFLPEEKVNLNIDIYDPVSQAISSVKENNNDCWLGNLSSDGSMLVFGEELIDDMLYEIKIYDTAKKETRTIKTLSMPQNDDVVAYFDDDDRIVFNGNNDGTLKRMDSNGANIETIAFPETNHSFAMFWISPDREKLIALETIGDYERLVELNSADGTRVNTSAYYDGWWNQLVWKGSNSFLYYHHENDLPKYFIFDLAGGSFNVTDLSNSGLGKEENICVFTKTGNLLSLSYQELYNGQTGSLIAHRADVPLWTNAMWGCDGIDDIYFADLDKSNFRRFIENKSGDINNDGVPDISDVILDLRIALGLDDPKPCSDINGDGVVDISDVILTLRMALGLDPLKLCTS